MQETRGLFLRDFFFIFGDRLKNFLVCNTCKVIFLIFLVHTVYDLTFF